MPSYQLKISQVAQLKYFGWYMMALIGIEWYQMGTDSIRLYCVVLFGIDGR